MSHFLRDFWTPPPIMFLHLNIDIIKRCFLIFDGILKLTSCNYEVTKKFLMKLSFTTWFFPFFNRKSLKIQKKTGKNCKIIGCPIFQNLPTPHVLFCPILLDPPSPLKIGHHLCTFPKENSALTPLIKYFYLTRFTNSQSTNPWFLFFHIFRVFVLWVRVDFRGFISK